MKNPIDRAIIGVFKMERINLVDARTIADYIRPLHGIPHRYKEIKNKKHFDILGITAEEAEGFYDLWYDDKFPAAVGVRLRRLAKLGYLKDKGLLSHGRYERGPSRTRHYTFVKDLKSRIEAVRREVNTKRGRAKGMKNRPRATIELGVLPAVKKIVIHNSIKYPHDVYFTSNLLSREGVLPVDEFSLPSEGDLPWNTEYFLEGFNRISPFSIAPELEDLYNKYANRLNKRKTKLEPNYKISGVYTNGKLIGAIVYAAGWYSSRKNCHYSFHPINIRPCNSSVSIYEDGETYYLYLPRPEGTSFFEEPEFRSKTFETMLKRLEIEYA